MTQNIFVFLFDGFSDWEISFLTPEIHKSKNFELVYFSIDGELVTSMGGLQIKPGTSLKQLKPEEIDMLVLPGGAAWENGEVTEITGLLTQLSASGKAIAAICAATTFLAQIGLLDNVRHTSNDLDYLKAIAPAYRGGRHYQHLPAVTDNSLITAGGIAPIEFAREVFKAIKLYDDENIEKWFQLFKNGIWSK